MPIDRGQAETVKEIPSVDGVSKSLDGMVQVTNDQQFPSTAVAVTRNTQPGLVPNGLVTLWKCGNKRTRSPRIENRALARR